MTTSHPFCRGLTHEIEGKTFISRLWFRSRYRSMHRSTKHGPKYMISLLSFHLFESTMSRGLILEQPLKDTIKYHQPRSAASSACRFYPLQKHYHFSTRQTVAFKCYTRTLSSIPLPKVKERYKYRSISTCRCRSTCICFMRLGKASDRYGVCNGRRKDSVQRPAPPAPPPPAPPAPPEAERDTIGDTKKTGGDHDHYRLLYSDNWSVT